MNDLIINIPGFESWVNDPRNGVLNFIDIDGVVLGGLGSYSKEIFRTQENGYLEKLNVIFIQINKLFESGNEDFRDLIISEYIESIYEDDHLFHLFRQKASEKIEKVLVRY